MVWREILGGKLGGSGEREEFVGLGYFPEGVMCHTDRFQVSFEGL